MAQNDRPGLTWIGVISPICVCVCYFLLMLGGGIPSTCMLCLILTVSLTIMKMVEFFTDLVCLIT
jgi:hypothetical protein